MEARDGAGAALGAAPARFIYADPPYPGMAHLYKNHPDYAGEVDHAKLARHLKVADGFALHTAATTLAALLPLFPGARIQAWVKPFAAFKRGVPVAYAWEPVLVKPVRKPKSGRLVCPLRDWIAEPMTMKRGLVGAKPRAVCWWIFETAGCEPTDDLVDLFPGSGAVTRAWADWRRGLRGLW